MEFASPYAYDYGGASSSESDNEQDSTFLANVPHPSRSMAPQRTHARAAGNVPSPPPPPPVAGTAVAGTRYVQKRKEKKQKSRKSDTNVINVKFGCLEENAFTSTAQPAKCSKCPAVMSNLEVVFNDLDANKGTNMMWKCSFCSAVNPISQDEAKQPRKEDMLFIPEGEQIAAEKRAAAAAEKAAGKEEGGGEDKVDVDDDSVLLFTLDISGSMGATVCQGSAMRNNDSSGSGSDDGNIAQQSSQDNSNTGNMNRGSSFLSNMFSRRPRTSAPQRPTRRAVMFQTQDDSSFQNQYLSRLDITKTALCSRLKDLKTQKPNVKLGVVTFCTDVTYLADGTSSKQKGLSRKHELDTDLIQKDGIGCKLPGPVKESSDRLKRAISGMHPQSMTALGPALLFSVAIAGKQNQSKVVICTDGMANVGIGSLSSEEPKDDFYDYVSDYANEFGVSVSVLAIEGADCRLTALGKVADATNGSVNIVSPTDLGSEYSGIISKKIVGSKVEITLVLHESLYVRDPLDPTDKTKSSYKMSIGNVTSETENFFEFGFKPRGASAANSNKNRTEDDAGPSTSTTTDNNESTSDAPLDQKKKEGDEEEAGVRELPFQLQISYVNKHKAQLNRVITTKIPCTKERTVAEKEADLALIAAHAVQTTAVISKEREYTEAKKMAKSKKSWFANLKQERGSNYNYAADELTALENVDSQLDSYYADLSRQQQAEFLSCGRNLSDDDSDDGSKGSKLKSRQKKKQERVKTQNDTSANVMFQNSKMTKRSMMFKK